MNLLLGDLIDNNISRRVLFSICIVALVIICLDFIFTMLSEISDLSENYGLSDAFIYSISSLPYSAYDFLSYICLIGVMVALGSLSEEGEITNIDKTKDDWEKIIRQKPSLYQYLRDFVYNN